MNGNVRVSHIGCRLDRKTCVREADISVHEKNQKYPFAPLAKRQVDPSREHPENFSHCFNALCKKVFGQNFYLYTWYESPSRLIDL